VTTAQKASTATEMRIMIAYLDLYQGLMPSAKEFPSEDSSAEGSVVVVQFPATNWALLHRLIAEEDSLVLSRAASTSSQTAAN
jgi:hypothetical protein